MSTETTDSMGDLGNPMASAPRTSVAAGSSVMPNFDLPKAKPTNVSDGFAPPVSHKLPDGKDLSFAPIDMDTWAETANNLSRQRRAAASMKLQGNPQLSVADREWLLMRLDDEPMTFMQVFTYRTETAEGIRNGLIRQLMKGMELPVGPATEAVKKIAPVTQRKLMRQIADPPQLTSPPPGGQDNPNAGSASTSETGKPMPGSSEESSPDSTLGA